MTVLAPAPDASPADWLVESLTTFAESVNSLVPAGFEAYVRVFHPAERGGGPLRWDEIAAEHSRIAHAGMQLGAITGHLRYEGHQDFDIFDRPPEEGRLPPDLAEVVARVLTSHTGTPDRCWFAVWDGFGALAEHVLAAPGFVLPQRRYHLLAGHISACSAPVMTPPWLLQNANLWWPDDRAWCVATEIDLKSTYVGCSRACAEELLAEEELESYEIDPATGIDWLSDTLNPPPERG